LSFFFAPGYLTQSPQLDPSHTVREAVESGLGRVLGLKTRFHELCDGVADLEPERRFAEHRIIDPEVQGVLAEIAEFGPTIAMLGLFFFFFFFFCSFTDDNCQDSLR
jgi:hypothetical protein